MAARYAMRAQAISTSVWWFSILGNLLNLSITLTVAFPCTCTATITGPATVTATATPCTFCGPL